jgi:hypothetical protein
MEQSIMSVEIPAELTARVQRVADHMTQMLMEMFPIIATVDMQIRTCSDPSFVAFAVAASEGAGPDIFVKLLQDHLATLRVERTAAALAAVCARREH